MFEDLINKDDQYEMKPEPQEGPYDTRYKCPLEQDLMKSCSEYVPKLILKTGMWCDNYRQNTGDCMLKQAGIIIKI